MDFNPLEIKRMMEQRQRELRGKKSATEELTSPTKRVRHEKENASEQTPSTPPVQGFMAKFAVSPKSVRKDSTLSQASPSAKSRLNELSKKYAEMEEEIPKSPKTETPKTPKKRAPAAPTTPKSSKKKAPSPPKDVAPSPIKKWQITETTTVTIRKTEETRKGTLPVQSTDPSEAKVSEKAKNFEKNETVTRVQLPAKTRVYPRGKIAEKVSQFDVGNSGPRCVIETKPLGSVSSRAKFFERAMADDKKAADAVYIPVSQRASKELEREEKALNDAKHQYRPVKPVVCETVVERREIEPTVDSELSENEEEASEVLPSGEEEEETKVQRESEGEEAEPMKIDEQPEKNEPTLSETVQEAFEQRSPTKKVGQVSNKLKNRLEEMIVHGHQTPEETLLSISERTDIQPKPSCSTVMEEEEGDIHDDDFLLSPHLRQQRQRIFDDDTISRITGIPEDGHSTPKCGSEESLATPLQKTMSQYRMEEKEAQRRNTDVKRIVYEIPSNMMQELRKGKEPAVDDSNNDNFEAYKRNFEEELIKQESIMKQTSRALIVCQENGDQGSEQQVEAERLLLIATQRHHVVQSELQRINLQRTVPQSGGTLSICDIQLPFKNEFLKIMRQCNEVMEYTHYFIVLVRSGASLIHTEMVSTDERIAGGCVSLGHHMVLKNLQEGFRAFIEVYAVQALNRNHPDYELTLKKLRREKEKESNKGGGILSAFTPSKKKHGTPHGSSGSEDVKIRKPSFGLIGRVTLDENLIALDKQVHYLDSYFHDSPLDGRILMKIQLNLPPKVMHCGMLRLKDTQGMFGGVDFIKSFFAAIEGSHLNLWNDIREAEEEKEPIRSFDLSQAAGMVRVGRSFNFYYFPLKLSNGTELNFLTYAEEESNIWADKLNACINRLKKKY